MRVYMLEDEAKLLTADMTDTKLTDEQYEEMESIDRLRWLVWSMRAEIDQ